MDHWNVRRVGLVAAGLVLAASTGGTGAPARCCFTNPRYVGTCEVAPGADETCDSILAYLNNPQSQGRTYCGNTSIRGDWQPASCEAKTNEPARP
jgi:hypothetical protein